MHFGEFHTSSTIAMWKAKFQVVRIVKASLGTPEIFMPSSAGIEPLDLHERDREELIGSKRHKQ